MIRDARHQVSKFILQGRRKTSSEFPFLKESLSKDAKISLDPQKKDIQSLKHSCFFPDSRFL